MVTLQPTRPTVAPARLAPRTWQRGAAFGLMIETVPSLRLRLPMHSAAPAIHCWTRARLLSACGGRGVGHRSGRDPSAND
jgi:hypothetical protein